jgi:four helix bundle protein
MNVDRERNSDGSAAGSIAELETLLDLTVRLGYVEAGELDRPRMLADETGRMLSAIRRSLETPGIGERDSDELSDAALV